MSLPEENVEVFQPRLLIGLGNPGREYELTRHNVGFMVLDALVKRQGLSWVNEKRFQGSVAKFGNTWLLKPYTFMNLSGQSALAMCRFYKLDRREVMAVYDDVDLPLGRMRLRPRGSAGGHNGVRSLISNLGGDDFSRLKFGVSTTAGRPSGDAMVGHVLGRFREDEQETLQHMVILAVDALNTALTDGFAAAMNKYNQTDLTQPL